MKTITYLIGAQFANYEANGETEGLSPEEIIAFDSLTDEARENAPEGHRFAHWSIDSEGYDNEFARCEVTGLHGICYRFEAVYFSITEETTA